jgi:hypothetical protein
MQGFVSVAIVFAAIFVVILTARVSARRKAASRSGTVAARAPEGGQLIAVIAAAISAASGMAPEGFRIVGVEKTPNPSSSSIAQRGFNTPVWGHVDRYNRGENL